MKYAELKQRHDELEQDIISALTKEVENSKTESVHMHTKAVKIDVLNYRELAVINDRLTFIDDEGYHHSIYSECSLDDLIDILNNI